jgi:hypothetical protein
MTFCDVLRGGGEHRFIEFGGVDGVELMRLLERIDHARHKIAKAEKRLANPGTARPVSKQRRKRPLAGVEDSATREDADANERR